MKNKWIIKIKGTDSFVLHCNLIRFKMSGKVVCSHVEFSASGYDLPQEFETQEAASEALFAIKGRVPVEMLVVEGSVEEYRKELYKV